MVAGADGGEKAEAHGQGAGLGGEAAGPGSGAGGALTLAAQGLLHKAQRADLSVDDEWRHVIGCVAQLSKPGAKTKEIGPVGVGAKGAGGRLLGEEAEAAVRVEQLKGKVAGFMTSVCSCVCVCVCVCVTVCVCVAASKKWNEKSREDKMKN